jgi:deoxyribose-phosphate aldolase
MNKRRRTNIWKEEKLRQVNEANKNFLKCLCISPQHVKEALTHYEAILTVHSNICTWKACHVLF